ncbi:MAG: ABC transporter permease, partial [Candidatus Geothermarchaeales archaeon]
MSTLTSISTLLAYEWKRALARKKVLIVIVLTALFEVIPFVVLTQVDAPIIQSILRQFSDLMWL